MHLETKKVNSFNRRSSNHGVIFVITNYLFYPENLVTLNLRATEEISSEKNNLQHTVITKNKKRLSQLQNLKFCLSDKERNDEKTEFICNK